MVRFTRVTFDTFGILTPWRHRLLEGAARRLRAARPRPTAARARVAARALPLLRVQGATAPALYYLLSRWSAVCMVCGARVLEPTRFAPALLRRLMPVGKWETPPLACSGHKPTSVTTDGSAESRGPGLLYSTIRGSLLPPPQHTAPVTVHTASSLLHLAPLERVAVVHFFPPLTPLSRHVPRSSPLAFRLSRARARTTRRSCRGRRAARSGSRRGTS